MFKTEITVTFLLIWRNMEERKYNIKRTISVKRESVKIIFQDTFECGTKLFLFFFTKRYLKIIHGGQYNLII